MKQWLEKTLETLESGGTAVLAVVVSHSGSAPGKDGAVLSRCGEEIWGTVGGGALEGLVTVRTASVTGCVCETYDLSNKEASRLGMICGGTADILYIPLEAAHAPALRASRDLCRSGKCAALAFACAADKVLLRCVGEEVAFTYQDHDDGALLLLPVQKEGVVYIFGGGHVSFALSKSLDLVEFPYVVYEDREEFAEAERFPRALERVCAPFPRWREHLSVTPSDYICIMTRGHQGDYEVLREALHTEAGYIGVIGSRKKMAITRERLAGDGFGEEDLARIVSPIGLSIGAQTPAEIAVSITAQLVQERSRR